VKTNNSSTNFCAASLLRIKPSSGTNHHQQYKAEEAHPQHSLPRRFGGLPQPKALGFGVAVSFLCHGFCSQHTCSTFIFLKDREKNKRAALTHRTKTHAKKNCLKLNNIM
jgi:hypothetical protein